MKYLFILMGLTSTITNAYVVLQVRKQDENHSNVDAFIHKVIPSKQFDQIAKKMARKGFDVYATHSQGNREKAFLAVNTENKREKVSDTVKILQKALGEFTDKRISPIFRTASDNIKPEVIHFDNDKPSVMFKVKTNTIINAMKDILASEPVEKFVDHVARKAADVVFHSMGDEKK